MHKQTAVTGTHMIALEKYVVVVHQTTKITQPDWKARAKNSYTQQEANYYIMLD